MTTKYATASAATLLVVVVFFFVCLLFPTSEGIKCWDCNSKNDPRCGEHNFSPYSIGFVDCDQKSYEHLKEYKPKYCRKIIQTIGSETRTIRGCGWLDDYRASSRCYTRTGTKDVMVTFCQCEGDMCNTGVSFRRESTAATVTSLALSLLFSIMLF